MIRFKKRSGDSKDLNSRKPRHPLEVGFYFGIGAMIGYTVLNVVLNLAGQLVHEATFNSTSDGVTHSGLILYTDQLTGCQYLAINSKSNFLGTARDTLGPRLNKDGKPMCEGLK